MIDQLGKMRIIEIGNQGCDVYQGTSLIHKHPEYVEGSPVMTSTTTPSPYVVYTENYHSSPYAVWNAFSDNNDRYVTRAGSFDINGNVIGAYPYVWLNLGNVDNRKRFCKMNILVEASVGTTHAPRAITLGYSNDNVTYTYYPRITDLIEEKWENNNMYLEFYFEAPETPQQYWSLSIVENNGSTAGTASIKRLTFYTDINNQ